MANQTDKKDRARTNSTAHKLAASDEKRGDVAVRRKGKQSLNWKDDMEILYRLETVSEMMLTGATTREIATATGMSPKTALLDKKRVNELWQDHSLGSIEQNMATSVTMLRRVQREAWSMWHGDDASDIVTLRNPKYLDIILKAESSIADIQGTKRFEIEHKGGVNDVLGRVLEMDDEAIMASLETVTTVRLNKITGKTSDDEHETIVLPDDAVKEVE